MNTSRSRKNLGTPAAAWLAGGVSRHGGCCCRCCYCVPVAPASIAPWPAQPDTRPRVSYSLPSGELVAIAFDHGEMPPAAMSYLVNGQLVTAVRS